MRVRWALVALASGALALGTVAPAAVTAAPRAVKPSGEAMVRIDGGNARAIERGKNSYRIILPREAAILWLGDSDRKLTIGTLGRKGLVGGWARLGHGASADGAPATITWQARGEARAIFVGAHVGKPRIGSDGLLTFLAQTTHSLPAHLPSFTLNISRPIRDVNGPTVRSGYPLKFPVNAASSTVGVQATATGDVTATVVFGAASNGVITSECSRPEPRNLTVQEDYFSFAGTCGDTTWAGGILSFSPMQAGFSTSSSQIQMSANVVVKGGNPSSFPWNFNMAEWRSGGVKVWP